jgi:ParB family chromosome partitioning protein
MDAEKIQELADSIRAEGLLQPIVVRPVGERYQLIAGERRLRACQLMGLKTIACRILKVSNASSAVLALIENLQREGLNPIDESMGYASLMRDFDLTQEAVAERMGKNRSTIANALRLLQLDREIQAYLAKNLISTGHAKVIAGIEDSAQQVLLARRILEEGLSVRQTEELARHLKAPQNNRLTPVGQSPSIDPSIQQLERHISQSLGAKVLLKHTDKKGRLVIEYYGPQDLQRILEKTGLGHVSFSL